MSERPVMVVKYGSDSVANSEGIDGTAVTCYVDQLVRLKNRYDLVVVSSGAVAVGRVMAENVETAKEPDNQALAMMGNAAAFRSWQINFARHGIGSGYLPVTHHEIDDPEERKTMRNAISNFLEIGWVPVINENDALSEDELKELSYGGDNDGLARHVAVAIGAARLLLLTDRPGLLDENDQLVLAVSTPEQYLQAQGLAQRLPNKHGKGMKTKVKAAWEASSSGIEAVIGSAATPIEDVINLGVSTYFPARH